MKRHGIPKNANFFCDYIHIDTYIYVYIKRRLENDNNRIIQHQVYRNIVIQWFFFFFGNLQLFIKKYDKKYFVQKLQAQYIQTKIFKA